MNEQRKKIAILMTLAGGGHVSAAKSLEQILGQQFEIVVINFYKDVIKSNDEEVYNCILKYNLSFLYWPIFIKLFRLKLLLLKNIYIKACRKYFKANKFDLIISVIPFFNDIIAKSIDTKFIILPTDLANPYPGYWYAKSDLIITCSDKLFQQAQNSGYSNAVAINSLPIRHEFYLPTTDFKPNHFIKNILITYGKTPPNKLIKWIRELSTIENIALTVICGKNQHLFNKINTFPNVTAYQFINNMREIIDSHQVVISKPGTTTIFEAINRRKYLLVEYNSNTMKQERYNAEFVSEHHYGKSFGTLTELKSKIIHLSTEKILYGEKLINPSQKIIQIVNQLIQKN